MENVFCMLLGKLGRGEITECVIRRTLTPIPKKRMRKIQKYLVGKTPRRT
jgi:hypothetical protein